MPSYPIRQASSYAREYKIVNENTLLKTCRTPGIPGNDFRNEGREVQTLFRQRKLAKVQLFDPPLSGSLVEGSSDRSYVSPALNDDSINLHLAPADHDPNSSEGVIDSTLTSANEEFEKPDEASNRPRSGDNDYDNSINANSSDGTIVDQTNAGDETKDREELARSARLSRTLPHPQTIRLQFPRRHSQTTSVPKSILFKTARQYCTILQQRS